MLLSVAICHILWVQWSPSGVKFGMRLYPAWTNYSLYPTSLTYWESPRTRCAADSHRETPTSPNQSGCQGGGACAGASLTLRNGLRIYQPQNLSPLVGRDLEPAAGAATRCRRGSKSFHQSGGLILRRNIHHRSARTFLDKGTPLAKFQPQNLTGQMISFLPGYPPGLFLSFGHLPVLNNT